MVGKMNLINIEGWPAAGKTTLWGLLDGTSDIFVDPLHNYTHYAGLNSFDNLTIREYRKFLSNTEFYKIEQYSISRNFPISYGAGKNRDCSFDFDFDKFNNNLRNIVTQKDGIDGLDFVKNFMQLYLTSYNLKKHSSYRYFATMSNYFDYKKYTNSKLFKASKTIVVTREPIDIIASRINRKPREVDGNETSSFAPNFIPLLFSSEIEEINSFNNHYKKLSRSNPKNVMVISLDDLIYNKKKSMLLICEFLNISFDKLFLKATRDSIDIEDDSYNLTNKINDNYQNILSLDKIILIRVIELIWKVHKQPISIFNPFSILRFLYLKIRGYR